MDVAKAVYSLRWTDAEVVFQALLVGLSVPAFCRKSPKDEIAMSWTELTVSQWGIGFCRQQTVDPRIRHSCRLWERYVPDSIITPKSTLTDDNSVRDLFPNHLHRPHYMRTCIDPLPLPENIQPQQVVVLNLLVCRNDSQPGILHRPLSHPRVSMFARALVYIVEGF